MKLTSALILLLVATAPFAAAAPNAPADVPTLPDAEAPSVEAETPSTAGLQDAAAATGAAITGAAKALGEGVAAVAKGIWNGAAFLAAGIWSGLTFLATGVWAGLVGLVNGIAFIGRAIGSGLAFVGSALVTALVAVGSGIGSAASFVGGLFVSGARFAAAHPRETAIATGSTAGAGGLLYLLRRFGWLAGIPLYTRLAPGQMLDNDARARVYEQIRAHPGKHVSALAEDLNLGWGTITYHLQRLETGKLVMSRTVNNRKCFFVVGSELASDQRTAVAALSGDAARRIVDAVRDSPGIVQKDLAERLGMSQALLSFHVKRLVKSDVLVATRQGRANALTVAAHVPTLGPSAVPA